MADLTSGASAKIQLDPGQSLRVEAEGGTTNVTALYGAPAGTTAVTGSTKFGPYSVPAVLRVVCASGACSYATVRDEPAANALTAPQVTALQAVVSEYENGTLGGGGNAAELMQRPMTVGFAGDSIATQWAKRDGNSPLWWASTELWPCEYQTVLATDLPGTSSSTLISSQIALLEAMETPPDVVIVQSIQNDYIGNTANADTYFANYQQYAERAIAAGVSLVCLCARPPKSSPPDVASALQYLNRKIENYCRNTPGTFFVDVMSAWRLKTAADTSGTPWQGTGGQPDAYSNDGVHPLMTAGRAAAPLILPVLQKYARPLQPLISAPIDYDDATVPYGNVLGQEGLMIGTNGRLNGSNNSGVAGSAANAFKRWEITDGNGITATPSIVVGSDGYRYQRIDLSGTASAVAEIRMRHQYVLDVSPGTFVAEATVIASGLTGVKDIGFFPQGFDAATAAGSFSGTEAISISNSAFRFRTKPSTHSNSGFSSKSNDVYVTFNTGTVVSGYILVGRVGIHRVA